MAFVAVRMSFACPECGGALALNRVTAELLCHHCLSPVESDYAWPANVLGRCWEEPATAWEIGVRRRSINLKLRVQVEAEHVAALPAELPARDADAFVATVFPGAVRVHGEAFAVLGPSTPASQPILFACLGCGAGLKVDGTSRVVACEYCKQS